MFDKILIANRGEIALRVMRACRELGIQTVAVHSTADEEAMHVRLADESVCIGPPPARDSYLNIPAIVSACEITGAEAVHPGYGFLSENARFAEILTEHGIKFIGPSADHIRVMGDKIEAKRTAKALGHSGRARARRAASPTSPRRAQSRGISAIRCSIKATAGGGGRGMKVARFGSTTSKPPWRLRKPKRKPRSAMTKSISRSISQMPRHIEIQVLGDGHGRAVHLGRARLLTATPASEGVGRSHSPALNSVQRDEIGGRVAQAMRDLGYEGVGTVEFLYENGQFYFIEMNTRLQVEHPVTEMLTGLDLVQEQISIAAGAALKYAQKRHFIQRPCHRVPDQRRESANLRALAWAGRRGACPRVVSVSGSIWRSMPAIAFRRITTV